MVHVDQPFHQQQFISPFNVGHQVAVVIVIEVKQIFAAGQFLFGMGKRHDQDGKGFMLNQKGVFQQLKKSSWCEVRNSLRLIRQEPAKLR